MLIAVAKRCCRPRARSSFSFALTALSKRLARALRAQPNPACQQRARRGYARVGGPIPAPTEELRYRQALRYMLTPIPFIELGFRLGGDIAPDRKDCRLRRISARGLSIAHRRFLVSQGV